jgi:hypothetical protein
MNERDETERTRKSRTKWTQKRPHRTNFATRVSINTRNIPNALADYAISAGDRQEIFLPRLPISRAEEKIPQARADTHEKNNSRDISMTYLQAGSRDGGVDADGRATESKGHDYLCVVCVCL